MACSLVVTGVTEEYLGNVWRCHFLGLHKNSTQLTSRYMEENPQGCHRLLNSHRKSALSLYESLPNQVPAAYSAETSLAPALLSHLISTRQQQLPTIAFASRRHRFPRNCINSGGDRLESLRRVPRAQSVIARLSNAMSLPASAPSSAQASSLYEPEPFFVHR